MPVYTYLPKQGVEQARLGIIPLEPAAITQAKKELIQAVIETSFDDERHLGVVESSTEEYVSLVQALHSDVMQIQGAEPNDLPKDVVLPLMEVLDPSAVVDSETGLALSVNDPENPIVNAEDIGNPDDFHKWIDDDSETYKQILRGGFNSHAYQIQPGNSLNGYVHTEHTSLGYVVGETGFQPVVTVLQETHPIRQAVAATTHLQATA